MKKVQTKSGNILCIEIPEDAYDFEEITDQSEIPYKSAIQYFIKCVKTGYPQGESVTIGQNFKIIKKLSELTEEDCGEFVELTNTGLYKIYDWSEKKVNELGIQPVTNFAKKSFLSLLESEGIDTSKEYLIIRLYYDRYSN